MTTPPSPAAVTCQACATFAPHRRVVTFSLRDGRMHVVPEVWLQGRGLVLINSGLWSARAAFVQACREWAALCLDITADAQEDRHGGL